MDIPFYISVTPTSRSNLSRCLPRCGMDLELCVLYSYLQTGVSCNCKYHHTLFTKRVRIVDHSFSSNETQA